MDSAQMRMKANTSVFDAMVQEQLASRLETLRRACPCAGCGGEPDLLGHISRSHMTYTDESFHLVGFDLIGGYALQPRWADGHSTGIYSFTYLRRLGEALQ